MRVAPKLFVAAFVAGIAVASAGFAVYQQAQQPHLTAALESLKQAKHHFEESKSKGMHTTAAMTATDQAIMHTQEAIKAGEEGAMK